MDMNQASNMGGAGNMAIGTSAQQKSEVAIIFDQLNHAIQTALDLHSQLEGRYAAGSAAGNSPPSPSRREDAETKSRDADSSLGRGLQQMTRNLQELVSKQQQFINDCRI